MAKQHRAGVTERRSAAIVGAKGLAVATIVAVLGWGPDAAAQEDAAQEGAAQEDAAQEDAAQEDIVAISDARAIEGTDLVFHVLAPSGEAIAFTWELDRGSATEGVDYGVQTQRAMTIPKGQRDARIVVPTVQDGEVEPHETVVMEVSGAGWTEVAVGTIVDDDIEPVLAWDSPLVIVEVSWIAFLLLLVILAKCCNRFGIAGPVELRALSLPRGSVRAILALFAVGSFVIVLVLGGPVIGEHFDTVLAAFGTLTGSIIGFYFGNRGASTGPAGQQEDEVQELIADAGGRFGDEGAQAVGVWMRLNPGGDPGEVRRAAKVAVDIDEFKEMLDVT